ncbi:DUF2330 domain-containing protein [Kamptonema cortianum]|nr:DUF2330 domain-containing protein [Geitlerinema splendidum]MDK3158456.1 DUF2330 domain-containing protein [Kamptonema cortianum]
MAKLRSVAICFSVLTFSLSSVIATGCCSVSWVDIPVKFGEQRNVILWNSKTKTEHFIRDARFETVAPDFGFIAPTPTKPILSEADPRIFDVLQEAMPFELRSTSASEDPPTDSVAMAAVEVVQVEDVGGYRATTLKATDATALVNWLKENKYQATDETEAWLKYYVEKDWFLTAFKVVNAEDVAATGTIRMSFQTEEPFNPYYVPEDNIPEDAPGMTLYFVSDQVYDGKIGGTVNWKQPNWSGELHRMYRNEVAELLQLSEEDLPARLIVTAFYDGTFPQASQEDLYFNPSPFQPGGESKYLPWVGGGLLASVIALWVITRRNQVKLGAVPTDDDKIQ